MSTALALQSYEEYLDRERSSEARLEYRAGEIVAMAGGTLEHARLSAAVAIALGRALTGRPCLVLTSDAKVRIDPADRTTYPDVSVVCGEMKRSPKDDNAIINPKVVIEVLSDGTEADDRGDKFAAYRRLQSVDEYVLVSQREPRIEVYRRDGFRWILTEARSGEKVSLPSLELELEVDQIYANPLEPKGSIR
ncbi:MAG: Uma2 family endonuclease [Deltaproteobacteria bacterium]|nr:Uma2 family endonuclease [Deltaproteobacteria bacterium]